MAEPAAPIDAAPIGQPAERRDAACEGGTDRPAVPTCVAVVVHYRDAEATLRCVASLRAQQERLAIVLVDNESPDGSGAVVHQQLADQPDVLPVRSPYNAGFGAGCNLGIDRALAAWPDLEHVLLLNPDAELRDGALAELRATARKHPRAGVVGCRIDDATGKPWFRNGRIPRLTLSGFHCSPPHAPEHRTDFITGACMLLAGDLLRDGLRFCAEYFLYCEDADLCEQVRRRGRELWITQRAVAVHTGGGSQPGTPLLGELTAERLRWLTRAKVLFAHRQLRWLERWVFLAVAWLVKPVVGALRSGSLRFLPAYLGGLRDGHRAARRRRR